MFTANTPKTAYIGRFAPSPTGPVHPGTLLAAVGSYLQAKASHGQWLLRMEDVDVLRKVDGADTMIVKTLEDYGFQWDGNIEYQSQRTHLYQQALDLLMENQQVYPCTCSRKQLAESGQAIYPGTCRQKTFAAEQDYAIRIRVEADDIEFSDCIMGRVQQNLRTQCGDFIIKRRDGLFAYQLAVVVDDAEQGVTEVVRGADLIDSTPRQIYLQQQLNYATPRYCHLPLVVDEHGRKISKSEGAAEVCRQNRQRMLTYSLALLGQQPPDTLRDATLDEIWHWAINHWSISKVPAANVKMLFD
jgi:glutamyl-Q tRNA(Asp) synthetase